MLKKINSLLTQSSGTATNTAATKKPRPSISFADGRRSSVSAAAGLPVPVRSTNTIKLYVSYDNGLYSTFQFNHHAVYNITPLM